MRLIAMVLIAAGLCLRFVDLGHKVFWYDEAFTSLRAAGHTEAEVVERFARTSAVPAAAVQRYLRPDPDRGVVDTVASLAVEDPQHPPLYYALAHVWMRYVGSSVPAMRTLPAALSVLALPAMSWLCWELFVVTGVRGRSRRLEVPGLRPARPAGSGGDEHASVGWLGAALVAVSPLHLAYAQESRQYSLWAVVTLLATAALLRALRCGTARSWALYASTVALGLYTFTLTVLVVAAHGVYVAGLTRLRPSRALVAPLLGVAAGVAVWSPWLWVTLTRLDQVRQVTRWVDRDEDLLTLVTDWARILTLAFSDRLPVLPDVVVQGVVVGLTGVAFHRLCRRTPVAVWLAVVTLAAVPALGLALPDLVLGGMRSIVPRYHIPSLLAAQVAVAYLLAFDGADPSRPQAGRRRWRWGTIALLSAGISSCLLMTRSPVWWNKDHDRDNAAVAAIVNQSRRPLVISDTETGHLLALSQVLAPTVDVLVRPRCFTCDLEQADPGPLDPAILRIPAGYSDVFLFHPRSTPEWRRRLSTEHPRFAAAAPHLDGVLWRLARPDSPP